MNIALVANTAWNLVHFRQNLIKTFLAEGYRVTAIAPPDPESERLLTTWQCEFVPIQMDNKGANPLKDLLLCAKLYRLYRQKKFDAVLHFTIKPNIYGSFACALSGISCVNNVTGLGTVFIRQNFTSRIALLLYRVAFLFPKKVFFQNTDDRDLFVKRKLVDFEKTDLLAGSGVDTSFFKPVEKTRSKFVFLMIARLLFDKGVLEYIEAIRILKAENIDAEFWLLGKIETDRDLGVSRETLAAWEKENLIRYLGTSTDVREWIGQSDCVVLPSYREGTPRTLLEGASMAKPLVATNVAGCKEVVEDGVNGLLCEVRSAKDLAKKMKLMRNLEEKRRTEMGRASREIAVRKFGEHLVIAKYKEAVRTLEDIF